MNDDQKIIMPNGGIILNRVHLEIGEGFVKHSYELDAVSYTHLTLPTKA